jgi:hypothetical protein
MWRQISALAVVTRGAGMQRNIADLRDAMAIVGIVTRSPLKQVLLLIQRLGDQIREARRHVGAPIDGRAATCNLLLAAQQANGNVARLEI